MWTLVLSHNLSRFQFSNLVVYVPRQKKRHLRWTLDLAPSILEHLLATNQNLSTTQGRKTQNLWALHPSPSGYPRNEKWLWRTCLTKMSPLILTSSMHPKRWVRIRKARRRLKWLSLKHQNQLRMKIQTFTPSLERALNSSLWKLKAMMVISFTTH